VAALEPIYVHGGGAEAIPSVQLPMSYDVRSARE